MRQLTPKQDDELGGNNHDPAQSFFTASPVLSKLCKAFPMGLVNCPYSTAHLLNYLPSESRALELVDLYYRKSAQM